MCRFVHVHLVSCDVHSVSFCSASLHDSCTRHIVEKQTCQTHYKNADHWHKGGLYVKIWIAAFSRLDSKKNLTYRCAFQPCRCIYVYAHTGIEKDEKIQETFLPPLTFLAAQWLQTPVSAACCRLSSLPVSLSLTHFSTCSYRVALVALCGGVR